MRYMQPNRESECLKNEGFTLNHQHNRLICWTWGTTYSQQIHVYGTKVTWIDCFMFYQRQIKRRYISSGAMELQNGTTFFWNLSAPGCSVINRAKTAWNQHKPRTRILLNISTELPSVRTINRLHWALKPSQAACFLLWMRLNKSPPSIISYLSWTSVALVKCHALQSFVL